MVGTTSKKDSIWQKDGLQSIALNAKNCKTVNILSDGSWYFFILLIPRYVTIVPELCKPHLEKRGIDSIDFKYIIDHQRGHSCLSYRFDLWTVSYCLDLILAPYFLWKFHTLGVNPIYVTTMFFTALRFLIRFCSHVRAKQSFSPHLAQKNLTKTNSKISLPKPVIQIYIKDRLRTFRIIVFFNRGIHRVVRP